MNPEFPALVQECFLLRANAGVGAQFNPSKRAARGVYVLDDRIDLIPFGCLIHVEISLRKPIPWNGGQPAITGFGENRILIPLRFNSSQEKLPKLRSGTQIRGGGDKI